MNYKELTQNEGMEFFPKVETIFLSEKEDLWANPFQNRDLRSRCFFELSGIINSKMTIFLHLTNKEVENEGMLSLPGEINLYGAYNYVSVCQMKSHGQIREMTENEACKFKKLICDRLDNKDIGDKVDLPKDISKKEISILMEGGKFLCFEPINYSYNTYERG